MICLNKFSTNIHNVLYDSYAMFIYSDVSLNVKQTLFVYLCRVCDGSLSSTYRAAQYVTNCWIVDACSMRGLSCYSYASLTVDDCGTINNEHAKH